METEATRETILRRLNSVPLILLAGSALIPSLEPNASALGNISDSGRSCWTVGLFFLTVWFFACHWLLLFGAVLMAGGQSTYCLALGVLSLVCLGAQAMEWERWALGWKVHIVILGVSAVSMILLRLMSTRPSATAIASH